MKNNKKKKKEKQTLSEKIKYWIILNWTPLKYEFHLNNV